MKKLFGARSPAIQLSLDDEDELGGLSSGFGGCVVPCLPCLTPFNGIQLNLEDATLDDYLDPSTPTTIDALLDAHEESGPAALQSPRHYLTRNPFASSSKVTTPTVVDSGAYDEQIGSSAGALPWVDFFMEKDDDDAEFLSDHRISAVIDDTSKLAARLDVFGSSAGQQQQDGGHSILDKDDEEDLFKLTQPFDIQSEWDEEPDDMYSTGGQQDEHHSDISSINGSPHLNDTSLDAHVITCELQSLDNHPGDMTKDNGVINESRPMEDVLTASESTNAQNNVPSNARSPYISPEEASPSGHDILALEENKTDIPPQQYPPSNDDDDEEDLFDFSKVIAMGKNVRHYSEDLMGNGLRLFNDFSTRMKNANRGDDMPQDGEQPQQEQSSMDQEFLLGDTFF
ncbi:hypothetical protein [Absidia glauca]|uniref:Uncharacterized protein n=1 Tax=Absidia glauca TaxID=4829 RepID=A0A163KE67_ABSGL|nr:hypothetical protein [Absidia glauca]